MRRALSWISVLLHVALIGVCLWPADSLSLSLVVVIAAAVLSGLALESALPRASALTLGIVAMMVLIEPALRLSVQSYDMRIAWTVILGALLFRRDTAVRVPSLVAAAVMAVTITPPSDTTLLTISPPLLLQLLVCVATIALQAIHLNERAWWAFYRIGEPLLIGVFVIAAVLPFGRNGLALSELLAWHVYVAITAALIALVYGLVTRLHSAASTPRA